MKPVVIVTGSRDWVDHGLIAGALYAASPRLVLEGGARGADEIAREWCDVAGVTNVSIPALWTANKKAAGPIRNRSMFSIALLLAETQKSEIVCLAFPLPQSRGTVDMMTLCKEAGVEVREFKQP